ncbi:MAG: hypothetical protein WKF75_00780 [Singulisphaera sp.]
MNHTSVPPVGLGQERVPPGEAEMIDRIVAIHTSVTDPDEKPVVPRGQHMKARLPAGEIRRARGPPGTLRRGIFAEPCTIDAYVRFSNGKGADDRQRDAHGMAIKLVGVPGAKLLEDEADATTQDFVLFDHPVFFIRDVADYVPFMEDFRRLKASTFTLGKVYSVLKLLLSPDYRWRFSEPRDKRRDSRTGLVLEHNPVEARRRSAVKYHVRPNLSGATVARSTHPTAGSPSSSTSSRPGEVRLPRRDPGRPSPARRGSRPSSGAA